MITLHLDQYKRQTIKTVGLWLGYSNACIRYRLIISNLVSTLVFPR
jgi:hypothetical protein